MSAPQGGYPAQGYPQEQYGDQNAQPGFEPTMSPQPQAGQDDGVAGGKKKKRGYAAQAYDFGAGANSALGGQPVAGGAFPPAQAPAYGGYPQQQPEAQQLYGAAQPAFGAPVASPAIGAPAYGGGAGGVGGYQPPDAGYPGPGASGVAGITQGMNQMGVGGASAPAVQPPQAAAARTGPLNQLYPTDLLTQPFNVAELELPPPPIVLPPNVSTVLSAMRN